MTGPQSSPRFQSNAVADHGLIGNLHTAALVAKDGTMDWLCYPHFDSPSLFGAVLDPERGGGFSIRPTELDSIRSMQTYVPDTNILETRFWGSKGVGVLTDFMPVEPLEQAEGHHRVVRRIEVTSGALDIDVWCQPRFDYGRQPARVSNFNRGAMFEGSESAVGLSSSFQLKVETEGAGGTVRLNRGEHATFILETVKEPRQASGAPPHEQRYDAYLDATVTAWRQWLRGCTYRGRWREQVHRSALVLKLLTFAPSGAMVAAPTTSLPTDYGGVRNWDYRYTWFRDSSFVVYALVRIGFREEANAFMEWVKRQCRKGPALQPLYRIDGSAVDFEEDLEHLQGHRDSRPVRIGNLASGQLQLDFYGALIDAVYLFNKYGTPVDDDLWDDVVAIGDWLCLHWHEPDQSIWEPRSEPRQYVFSKIMCWVALDRALRLATARSFPAPVQRWRDTRDEIARWVRANGWSESLESYVQSAGASDVDAALLMAPLVFFSSPRDRRIRATVKAVRQHLTHDALVRRYVEVASQDGLPGQDGAFGACCFWLVEALTREGNLREARRLFESLRALANPLGLYAEQFTLDGELLGNFPQALTHLAFISAAVNLDRALDDRKGRPGQRSTAWRAYRESEAGAKH